MRIILVQSEGKLHGTGHRTFHSVGLQSDQPLLGERLMWDWADLRGEIIQSNEIQYWVEARGNVVLHLCYTT